jgi:hypothetical protein
MGVAGGVERMYHARQFPALSVPRTTFLAWYSERRKTMNFRALPGWKATSLTSVPDSTHHDIPARRLPVSISRRQFARTAAASAFLPLLAPGYGPRAWWKRRHLLRSRSRVAPRCSVELTMCLRRERSIPSMQNPSQSQILMPLSDWRTSAAW